MNELYDLEGKAYLSFSGGKDSTVLSALIDMAIPDNQIPRVFLNTGIEYKLVLDFVRKLAESDKRIVIVSSGVNIPKMLEESGYPFKSKEHSQKVALYQRSGKTKTIVNYIGEGTKKNFLCPEKLRYNFSASFALKVSDRCCYNLKKNVAEKWGTENNRPITITGMRQGEGGLRQSMRGCSVFYDDDCKNLKKFHPLFPCGADFITEFVKRFDVRLCELYYPPYNFQRTGCKGCPYSLDLQRQLDLMAVYLPAERKQCETIWGKVYAEYRRIGYKLKDTLL